MMIMHCIELTPEADGSTVGAKAANLAVVMSLGLRVPRSCVVTREAVAVFLDETGLRRQAAAVLAGHGTSDAATRRRPLEGPGTPA